MKVFCIGGPLHGTLIEHNGRREIYSCYAPNMPIRMAGELPDKNLTSTLQRYRVENYQYTDDFGRSWQPVPVAILEGYQTNSMDEQDIKDHVLKVIRTEYEPARFLTEFDRWWEEKLCEIQTGSPRRDRYRYTTYMDYYGR